ncbi:MAG: phosphoribulokinase [Gemmatimonadaceae bacterium]|nr:phosphoribulokinase [Gemmatimonadaceae bacterium]
MSLRPILLAIVGDSAAGKSTLGAGISSLLGDERVTVVTTDDYHKHNRQERRKLRLSALHPDCNDLDLLGEHLEQLARGVPVVKAPYNHSTGDFDAPRTVTPSEFLIVEGLLGLHTPSLRERYDVSVYLDTPEPLRHRWKLARDTAKRGYSASQVQELLERRESVSEAYVRPQRAHADMVVRFHAGSEQTDFEHLHATVTMRPTLDQPDLRAVIESCPRAASALHLACASESETLEIDGAISTEQAAEVERELWSRRPELERLLMARTGNFIENGTMRHSHALAIAQLLLTYPVLRAKLAKELAQ